MLSSFDTNILIYAANEDCPEHETCKSFLSRAASESDRWIVADQVYLELYRALRNPRVLRLPLNAVQAAAHIQLLREGLGFLHCGYVVECWEGVMTQLKQGDFPYQRTHDAVLASTLMQHGVKAFYTRNTKDFISSGFQQVIDPLEGLK
jgi:predicted nucleic acid-binding protein